MKKLNSQSSWNLSLLLLISFLVMIPWPLTAPAQGGDEVPGTLKWSIPLGGNVGYCSPAIGEDGTIYTGAGQQKLYALNPNGTEKWSVKTSGWVMGAPAISEDGTIYLGTHSEEKKSRIHAFDSDGSEKWSFPVDDTIPWSSPAIAKDGTIFVGSYNGKLYAMNPDGTKKWSFQSGNHIWSSPAIGQDGTVYVGSEDGKLYAVKPKDGTKKWSFQTGDYIHGCPAIDEDGTVYIGSTDKNLYAVNPKDGTEKWRFVTKGLVHAPPVIGRNGIIYVGSNDGNLYAINRDGTKKWSFKTALRVDNGSAAIGKDGTIYVGSDDNHLYAVNPEGTEKWRFETGEVDDFDCSPAIGEDGTIYFSSKDGNLYAIYGDSGGLAESPWPMHSHDLRHTGHAQSPKICPANGKLKVFILSGQSNMVGFGQLAGSPGTMEAYLKSNPKDYGHLVDDNGKHVVRDDVWIVNLSYKGKEQMGWLTTGYGASPDHIGPEYGFGFVVGDYFEDPVLLIKSAWGGRSLYKNFLSPSSAEYPAPKADGDTGFQYAEVLRHVKEITGNLKKYYPGYSGKGYEIVGFGWHQGWNDRINQSAVDVYEKNMENFIKDIRKDLGIEKLPFVIANTGMGGWDIPITARYKKKVEKLMAAQLALGDPEKYPEFKDNVSGVETRDFQRTREESPSGQEYHWYRNWETLYLIGKGLGDSMVGLLSGNTMSQPSP